MYCAACGAELHPHHGACASCGHRVAPRAAVSPKRHLDRSLRLAPSSDETKASLIDLPIADLLREAWRRAPIGTLVLSAGVLMLVVLAVSALPLGFLLVPLLVPPLAAGLHIMALRALRGDPVFLKHAFAGFKRFLPLLGIALIPTFGAMLPAGLAAVGAYVKSPHGVFASVLGYPIPNPDSLIFAFVVGTAVFVLFASLIALPFSWSTWLVLDREESVLTALDASARMVVAHLVPVLKLWLALLALNAVGVLAIGIGALLTVPFSFVVLGCAYERFFGIAGGAHKRN